MNLLADQEPRTTLMSMALKDGIVTMLEYNAWILGYMSGVNESLKIVKGEKNAEQTESE